MPVEANEHSLRGELLDAAVAWLAERLPSSWSVTRPQAGLGAGGPQDARALEASIALRDPRGTSATVVVEARKELAPRDVEQLFTGLAGSLRALASHIPILVVAPWLSARTRERLAAEQVNYLDLTGNAWISLENPALFLQSTGALRSPEPSAPRGLARLRGAKAGRLMRFLADVPPPYSLREIAAETGLTTGYASRLLEALDREALIERDARGPVRAVHVADLLRRWAQGYDVFNSNRAETFIAPAGMDAVLSRLADIPPAHEWVVVTGSFAAVRHAPIAAPALLAVYCEEAEPIAQRLDLLPALNGGNVVLLEPFDPVVFERTEDQDGIRYAAASQVAVDCLTGNGRMPSEGDALLDWMTEHEQEWRGERP
jgi:hypothetical protein